MNLDEMSSVALVICRADRARPERNAVLNRGAPRVHSCERLGRIPEAAFEVTRRFRRRLRP